MCVCLNIYIAYLHCSAHFGNVLYAHLNAPESKKPICSSISNAIRLNSRMQQQLPS